MQLRICLALLITPLLVFSPAVAADAASASRPNIIFIIADDLGYGDLSCYGQQKFKTPNIDRIAAGGMKMSVHYSGAPVCAPSRNVLMAGTHTGHNVIRENKEMTKVYGEGQYPLPADSVILPKVLKSLGYTTGAFGKWGLGAPTSTGEPLKQGIDRFFGYNCQAVAHNYYPTYLWDNDKKIPLDNPKFPAHQKLPEGADPAKADYSGFIGKTYAPDVIGKEALKFLRDNKDKPFFLFYPTTVPHLALQVPEDSLAEFAGKFPEEPYPGGRGYLPHKTPRAAYAAMVTRMDKEVGKVLDLVTELGLDEKTIIVFVSDNGPLYNQLGGTDTDFFNSASGFNGRKGSVYEGGVRIPCLVKWKGKIAPGTTSDRVTGFEDWMPTLLDLIGQKEATPKNLDGISFAPTLLGQKDQPARPFLYRETPGYGGQQSVRVGNWKAVRQKLNPGPKVLKPKFGEIELYDLSTDPGEKADVAAQHADVVEKLAKIMKEQHVPSELFPMRALDK